MPSLRFEGEMGYVKHDVSKAIKTVMNSASGGFREQAADLKRVSGTPQANHFFCVPVFTLVGLLVDHPSALCNHSFRAEVELATPFTARERYSHALCYVHFPGERNLGGESRDNGEAAPFRRGRA